eukprot:COSAG06_NODE_43722_length_369_cov_1.144444_1_plen_36_part_10
MILLERGPLAGFWAVSFQKDFRPISDRLIYIVLGAG